jgi:ribosomal protein L30
MVSSKSISKTKKSAAQPAKRVLVTQIRSQAGRCFRVRRTLEALGLKGIGSKKDLPLNSCVLGMLKKVESVVIVEGK